MQLIYKYHHLKRQTLQPRLPINRYLIRTGSFQSLVNNITVSLLNNLPFTWFLIILIDCLLSIIHSTHQSGSHEFYQVNFDMFKLTNSQSSFGICKEVFQLIRKEVAKSEPGRLQGSLFVEIMILLFENLLIVVVLL